MVHKSTFACISFLAFVYSTSAVDVVFKHYYGGDTFDAEIETIYAQKDMIGFPGWEMLLTFDEPLTQLVVSVELFFYFTNAMLLFLDNHHFQAFLSVKNVWINYKLYHIC